MKNVTTAGRVLLKEALPSDLRPYADNPITASEIKTMFAELAAKHPDTYVDVLDKISQVSREAATDYGGITSFSLEDLKLPSAMKAERKKLVRDIDAITQDPALPEEAKRKRITSLMISRTDDLRKKLLTEAFDKGNAFAIDVEHGFRGNPTQFAQMLFGDMLVTDNKDQPIPIPGVHGYSEGVTPLEYWAGAYGSRRGFTGVQFATRDTGYFGKQLALMNHRVRVTGKDCGAKDVGVEMAADSPDLVGSVLAMSEAGIPAGTVLKEEHVRQLQGHTPVVRSLSTCQQPDGVCQKCTGLVETGRLPDIGEHIGIAYARGLAEPLMQGGLGSKHIGGTVGSDAVRQNLSGFDAINQFVQVPQVFRGAATLAPADGHVTGVRKAPQGGHYVMVGPHQTYVPEGLKVLVKRGDILEAGDTLSEGTPNPAEVVQYKGLGEGRQYFTEKFTELLRDNGVEAHPRLIAAVSRSFMDGLRVTDPDGVAGHELGERISYSELQKRYRPRKGAQDTTLSAARNRYLEQPVLHYTVGTRVTPSMQRRLKARGIGKVVTHENPPGFEPEVSRMLTATTQDPDWRVRLAGFNLSKGFMDAAQHGSTSPQNSTSYIPELMRPK